MRRRSLPTTASATGSCTSSRDPAQHTWPWLKKMPLTMPSTAWSSGASANVVFEDAPLDQAVEGIVNGIFFNQGQVCCAGSRLLVQESVYDEVLDRLKRR